MMENNKSTLTVGESIMTSTSSLHDRNVSSDSVWRAYTTDKDEPLVVVQELQPQKKPSRRRWIWILVGVVVAVLAIIGGVVGGLVASKVINVNGSKSGTTGDSLAQTASVSQAAATTVAGAAATGTATAEATKTSASSETASATSSTSTATPTAALCSTSKDIPSSAKGSITDVTAWLDMDGFNCTFTTETVGGLPIVGLNSTWDDSAQANPKVAALDKPWGAYDKNPIHGVNLGGWLSLEPFITPSLFDYPADLKVTDEYTLSAHLGKDAARTLEKHYATFITEADFAAMAAAGLDHVRIPFSYWAVRTYDDDPYPAGLSWRYLLRGIESARKHGLRVKLDLHGLPGSQNGWNHSGREGKVGWMAGGDAVNVQRSLDVHDQLSRFFAQERYRNVVAFYGLANEPATTLPIDGLADWTARAYKIVRDNGVKAPQVFSESMKGLDAWSGNSKLSTMGADGSLVIDVHQYAIFDNNLISKKHADKVAFACGTYAKQIAGSMDRSAGFGPVMVGEWSQADTDCARHLNGVGGGARWLGTFQDGTAGMPHCPTGDARCSCDGANADPAKFSEGYKKYLMVSAMAQMDVFEKGWGWFYWTWRTEGAALWSYKAGLDGGYMPKVAYQRDWDCSMAVPGFGDLPEYY